MNHSVHGGDPSSPFVTVSVTDPERFVRVTYHIAMTQAAISAGVDLGVKVAGSVPVDEFLGFLVDVRGCMNVESISTNYKLVHHDLERVPQIRRHPTALIKDPHDHTHDFLETAALNDGFSLRLFTDEQAAVAWLQERWHLAHRAPVPPSSSLEDNESPWVPPIIVPTHPPRSPFQ